MKTIPRLKAGDSVEIIAPASRSTNHQLAALKALLESWQLRCLVDDAIFGDDLLCAQSDENRLQLLTNALQRPETKAIICVRGGYGSMRLIPALMALPKPDAMKLFVGMSDITALHLFLQQQWQWPTIHGALNVDKFSSESISALKALLFGESDQIILDGSPLNFLAQKPHRLDAEVTGGNLCLVQASIGTPWQLNGADKIIFLEEVNERGYRVDRLLEHLRQAGIFDQAQAIVFGDFLDGNEPDGTCIVPPVLERFAQAMTIPVIQIPGIGHGYINKPLWLGAPATLQLGLERCQLITPNIGK